VRTTLRRTVFAVGFLAIAFASHGCSKPDEDADLVPPPGYVPKVVHPLLEAKGAHAHFGSGWFPMESNAGGAWRWMAKTGEIKITSGNLATGVHVRIEGWTPNADLPAPSTLRVLVDGREIDSFVTPPTQFVKEYDLPEQPDAGQETTVVLEVSATASPPGETRALGFALRAFSWAPRVP
jgi:hypothetical protein